MTQINNFRLSYETSFLFVLSNEYNIPFGTMLGMYNISDKLFWAYLSLLSPMSKMGVRKGGQLAKTANRLFKSLRGIKDRKQRKVEYELTDDEGNLVLDENGNIKKERKTVVEHFPIVLDETEEKLAQVMRYYITKGYSNGETFYTDEQILDKGGTLYLGCDSIEIDKEVYSRCSQMEYIFEKHFPDISVTEYRALSIKTISELIANLGILQEVQNG